MAGDSPDTKELDPATPEGDEVAEKVIAVITEVSEHTTVQLTDLLTTHVNSHPWDDGSLTVHQALDAMCDGGLPDPVWGQWTEEDSTKTVGEVVEAIRERMPDDEEL